MTPHHDIQSSSRIGGSNVFKRLHRANSLNLNHSKRSQVHPDAGCDRGSRRVAHDATNYRRWPTRRGSEVGQQDNVNAMSHVPPQPGDAASMGGPGTPALLLLLSQVPTVLCIPIFYCLLSHIFVCIAPPIHSQHCSHIVYRSIVA